MNLPTTRLEEDFELIGAENVAKILLRARELNAMNIKAAMERGDIEATMRIASNEAHFESMMKRRGVVIQKQNAEKSHAGKEPK